MLANYSLDQVKKAVVAAVVAVVYLVGFFVVFDPGFQVAAVQVVAFVFAVIGVFASKNHTADDASKAVVALAGSALALVGLFVTVDPGTAETVAAIVVQLGLVYGVFKSTNAEA
jgi:hypothetical protein